jgi:hypothetical protein
VAVISKKMNKRYYFLKDNEDARDQIFKLGGIILGCISLYLLVDPSQSNPIESLASQYAAVLLFVSVISLIVGLAIPFALRYFTTRLEISDSNLIVKNPSQPITQISIPDIDSIALNYVVHFAAGGAGLWLMFSKYFAKQQGYSIKIKNAQNFILTLNVENYPNFIKDLKTINPSILDDQAQSSANKQQADNEVKEKTAQMGGKKV